MFPLAAVALTPSQCTAEKQFGAYILPQDYLAAILWSD